MACSEAHVSLSDNSSGAPQSLAFTDAPVIPRMSVTQSVNHHFSRHLGLMACLALIPQSRHPAGHPDTEMVGPHRCIQRGVKV